MADDAPARVERGAPVVLDEHGLAAADVVRVARQDAPVELGPSARSAMVASAALIDGFLAADEPVYGVTTGFGSLATTVIPVERTAELQQALVRSHAAGMGPVVEHEVVRAMVLLRARSLAMGRSGARPEVAEGLVALLNAGLTPVVHEHGSLGASGDLAPLAHVALALIGEGEVWDDAASGWRRPPALAGAGLRPVVLRAKEGLALDQRHGRDARPCWCWPWPTSGCCSRWRT